MPSTADSLAVAYEWSKHLSSTVMDQLLRLVADDVEYLPPQYVKCLLVEAAVRLEGKCSDCRWAKAHADSRQCIDCFDGKYVEDWSQHHG